MEDNRKNCSSHTEVDSVSYCQKCEIFMCNKCEKLHSELFKNHAPKKSSEFLKNNFTGLCQIENHNNKLIYFCKEHNQLCCGLCIPKVKGKGNGQHSECTICFLEDIKDEKKKTLGENISKLKELSATIEKSINEIQLIFEKISKNKEELKLNLQKVFTSIRTKLNEREDELLKEIDNKYDEIYFKEDIIKEGKKLPKKVSESIQLGNLINNEWNENKYELNFLLNGCLDIEKNLEDIYLINESINKYNNNNTEYKYNPEADLNSLLEKIKVFGDLNFDNLPIVTEKFNISINPLIITLNDTTTIQKVTMDSYLKVENKNKIYHIIGYGPTNSIRIYDNFDSFKSQKYAEMKLPVKGIGTNWTIFKECLYIATENGNKIVKINLKTNKIEKELSINDKVSDTGQWGGYN